MKKQPDNYTVRRLVKPYQLAVLKKHLQVNTDDEALAVLEAIGEAAREIILLGYGFPLPNCATIVPAVLPERIYDGRLQPEQATVKVLATKDLIKKLGEAKAKRDQVSGEG